MKSLTQRNKDELLEVFEEFNLELPENPTKKNLLEKLAFYDIDNDSLRAMEENNDVELSDKSYEKLAIDSVTGEVIVAMDSDRNYGLYQFKNYKFTSERRFIPMAAEDAEELVSANKGFHKATREEINHYYS